jgi:hypothetical protein
MVTRHELAVDVDLDRGVALVGDGGVCGDRHTREGSEGTRQVLQACPV